MPSGEIRLLLCGDVMLGRGIDQVLPHPGDSALPESHPKGRDARTYVALAELRNGALPETRGPDYVWGDALAEFDACRADLRLINLETAVTAGGAPWPKKPVHYRMHPANLGVLSAAGIDCCALANNHTLDFGPAGLGDTVATLTQAGIRHAGAGRNRRAAAVPAVLGLPGEAAGGRVLVVSLAMPSSGCPLAWGAQEDRPGINLVGLNDPWPDILRRDIEARRRPGDIVVASIHWGDNFGHAVTPEQRAFAHRLIDDAGVDLIHGHSSHHVRAIEVHSGRAILYGCGDLINDYEGILVRPQRLAFAPELGLIYLARLSREDGRLLGLEMRPTRMQRLQVRRAGRDAGQRLAAILIREGARYGTAVEPDGDGVLHLRWQAATARRTAVPAHPAG